MQSFSDLFANNRVLAAGILLAAVAIILAVGVGLYRLLFGRRLHMAGGRTRQPRLGVVDAFDLDRQRQLVLVRRDNVEHLLMIGGPTDVVIESAIIRAPASLNTRDKENGITAPMIGVPAPAPAMPPIAVVAPLPVAPEPPGPSIPVPIMPVAERPAEPPPPSLPPRIEPEAAPPAPPVPMPQPEPRLPPAATLPTANRPLPTGPTQRAPTTMPPRPPLTPAPRPAATTIPPRQPFSRATPLPVGPGSTGRAELPRTPAREGGEAISPATVEPAIETPAAEPPVAPPPPIPAAPEPVAPPPITTRPLPRPPAARPAASPTTRAGNPSLGSLEEEMAKLLGRPLPPPDPPSS